jgi:DNA-binding MarR family transcriptional regulator
MTPHELLESYGIRLNSTAPGRYYTTCPQCSRSRKPAHQKIKCLGVTIEGEHVRFGCNHCGFTGPGPGTGNGHDHKPHEITYDYVDQDGNLLFQKVRMPPGSKLRFYLQRPDGNGGWIKNLFGIDPKPLYRWPEVIEAIADGKQIAIAEGEKDVDRLWKVGIPATCNFEGAAEPDKKPKWRQKYSEDLRGADLIVFNDNDPPGRAHAEAICEMSGGIVASIRRLDLAQYWPGMPEKADVSDWFDAGHTREELDELIAKAVASAGPQKISKSSAEFLNEIIPPDYVLDGVLQRRFLYSFTAITGSGKTAILLLLAAIIATGRKLGHHEVTKGRVLYFAGENPDDVRYRWKVMGAHVGFDPNYIDVRFIDKVLSITQIISHLRKEMAEFDPIVLVIVDTKAAYFEGDDENSNPQAVADARKLRTLISLPGGPCVVVACHPPKGATQDNLMPRGGGAFLAEIDGNLIGVSDGTVTQLQRCQTKFRGPEFEPIAFRLKKGVTHEDLRDAKGRLMPQVLAEHLSDQSQDQMEEATESNKRNLLRAISEHDRVSQRALARHLGWFTQTHEPLVSRINRLSQELRAEGLVDKTAKRLTITDKGQKALKKWFNGSDDE